MAINDPTRKILWTRAYDRCAFPTCQQALTHDGTDSATGDPIVQVIGEEAHIRSRRANGPRHDSTYPKEKLDSYDNLILLCPTHHTQVDAQQGAEFSVDALLKMRRLHESRQKRRSELEQVVQAYVADQYESDDKVLFQQVDLNGPKVDAMFVDVPLSCRPDAQIAPILRAISTRYPGDREGHDTTSGTIIVGAAQALLNRAWSGSGLIIGGPGQGKSTLLQYVCQFHRSRRMERDGYEGKRQNLAELTQVVRVPIRIDLRKYAIWATNGTSGKSKGRRARAPHNEWPSLETYMARQIARRSGYGEFSVKDLVLLFATEPVLIALDGLDEVANLRYREQVSTEIVSSHTRLAANALDLVCLVATRPGTTTSKLWSSRDFTQLHLQRLTYGLRLQYLQQWAEVVGLNEKALHKLQKTFTENQHVSHIRELASYPMQLAILLHLLYRRQLLPQQRTQLYQEYLKTFLDREQSRDKEPLLTHDRQIIEDVHAYLAWHIQTQAEEGASSGSITRDNLKALLREHLAEREGGIELAERLFTAMTSRVLCLIERDPGSFQFEVQSLREYFAALYIFENAPVRGERNSRDDCLNALLARPYWSNVCRFFVGMFSQVEVRGILQNFRSVGNTSVSSLAIRSMAVLLLSDRTYERQADGPIREVVDFILDGPGVVYAEDGLLDVAGNPLVLTDRAGQSQAVEHLKRRLSTPLQPDEREAVCSCLLRHTSQDDLRQWWWEQFDPSANWLEVAACLRVLSKLTSEKTKRLGEAVSAARSSGPGWVLPLLIRGCFDGDSPELLQSAIHDLNDGISWSDLPYLDRQTPIGTLVTCAGSAESRVKPAHHATSPAGTDRRRVRRRGVADPALSRIVKASELPTGDLDYSAQAQHLQGLASAWGEGWVLYQAISAIPHALDLARLARDLASNSPHLSDLVLVEADVRAKRGDVEWWRSFLANASSDLHRRWALMSLLGRAHTRVISNLAEEINAAVDSLEPRQLASLRAELWAARVPAHLRELQVGDVIRLQQAKFSAATLWLMRCIATDPSIVQIDKQLSGQVDAVLSLSSQDMRDTIVKLGSKRTVAIKALSDTRPVLPRGSWITEIKLGVLREVHADSILQSPERWPVDLVVRAVELLSQLLANKTATLNTVAKNDNWFSG